MAVWDQLKEMAGDIKDAFIQAVKDFIKQKIVEQAIQWIASVLIPGAGIIKAIIGIYDTVVFFIKKAKDIIKMVGNFLGSIARSRRAISARPLRRWKRVSRAVCCS